MRRTGIVVALCVAAVGCPSASTSLVRTWRDPGYSGREAKRLLVIGLAPNEGNRKTFEYAVAARLQHMKYEPVTAYDVLPRDRMADRETIAAVVKERGIDLVLVSRLVSKHTEAEFVPTAGYATGGYYPYYAGGYSRVYAPGYVAEREVVYLETNAYDARQERLVWSGTSRTFDHSSIEDVSDSVAEAIASALKDQGVI
jgi:hypothetical protein